MQQRYSYQFYPSLLDSFQRFVEIDEEIEGYNNVNDEGEYKVPPDEIIAKAKQDLLNSINRKPFDSEAADKGTAFNEIIDCFIHNKKPENKKVRLKSDRSANFILAEMLKMGEDGKEEVTRHFLFDLDWCIAQAKYYRDAASQVFTEADINTKYGVVRLYGYIDEIMRDKVIDIKTTGRYDFGKFERKWQRHVYPYCLIESGMMSDVEAFEYTVYVLKGGTSRTPLISGTVYPELYKYKHEQTTLMLRAHCERFIEFIEANRDLIEDKKIFGGVNES